MNVSVVTFAIQFPISFSSPLLLVYVYLFIIRYTVRVSNKKSKVIRNVDSNSTNMSYSTESNK